MCRRGRDYGIVSERELAHLLRGLMKFIYPAHSIPAEYEIAALLKNVDREYADVDSNMYRLHFGQYFRFDISTQLPFFYKSVQKMLVGIVVDWADCGSVRGPSIWAWLHLIRFSFIVGRMIAASTP